MSEIRYRIRIIYGAKILKLWSIWAKSFSIRCEDCKKWSIGKRKMYSRKNKTSSLPRKTLKLRSKKSKDSWRAKRHRKIWLLWLHNRCMKLREFLKIGVQVSIFSQQVTIILHKEHPRLIIKVNFSNHRKWCPLWHLVVSRLDFLIAIQTPKKPTNHPLKSWKTWKHKMHN